jgi:hypothetical protein
MKCPFCHRVVEVISFGLGWVVICYLCKKVLYSGKEHPELKKGA